MLGQECDGSGCFFASDVYTRSELLKVGLSAVSLRIHRKLDNDRSRLDAEDDYRTCLHLQLRGDVRLTSNIGKIYYVCPSKLHAAV